MKRTFKNQMSIGATNTPQPLVGTTLTALINAGAGAANVAVADSTLFAVNDLCIVGAGTAAAETVKITGIPDATHISVSTANAHANGAFVQLSLAISSLYVQREDGDAAALYIGSSINMTATAYLISKLVGVAALTQPEEFSDNLILPDKKENLQEYWVYGTLNTVYTVSCGIS